MDKNRQKHLYGWLRKQSGHGRRWIGISIAFGLGQGVLMVMQAWLLATLLHGFIIEGSTPEHSALFISLLLVTLTKAALAYGRGWRVSRRAVRCARPSASWYSPASPGSALPISSVARR